MKKMITPPRLIVCLLIVLTQNVFGQGNQEAIGNMAIEGSRQGDFNEGSKKEKSIPTLGFDYSVQTPHDMASGMATGKRQHTPVVIFKAIDNASPQILQALNTGEVLKSVTIDLLKSENGKLIVIRSIRLINAMVSKISQYGGAGAPSKMMPNYSPIEEVSFTFQKIEMLNGSGKTISADDWMVEK
jgi:type VI secretion system secreted protein Hcp